MLMPLSAHNCILPDGAARQCGTSRGARSRWLAGWRTVSESTHQPRVAQHDPATERVNQPGREEAVVRTAAEPITHERPEEWGWHGEMGRWGRIGGGGAGVGAGPLLVGRPPGPAAGGLVGR